MPDDLHPNPGLGVDSGGNPVVDPTANVLRLVEAAIRRQDDLRESSTRHLEETASLRADHAKELRTLERQRLDAIRQVDVTAAQQLSAAAEIRAGVLATSVTESAEALRIQVEATRQQTAVALEAALAPIKNDVADLRRIQFEQQGQKAAQAETKTDVQTRTAGNQWTIGTVIAIVAVLISLTLGVVVATSKHNTTTITCSGTPIVCK